MRALGASIDDMDHSAVHPNLRDLGCHFEPSNKFDGALVETKLHYTGLYAFDSRHGTCRSLCFGQFRQTKQALL